MVPNKYHLTCHGDIITTCSVTFVGSWNCNTGILTAQKIWIQPWNNLQIEIMLHKRRVWGNYNNLLAS